MSATSGERLDQRVKDAIDDLTVWLSEHDGEMPLGAVVAHLGYLAPEVASRAFARGASHHLYEHGWRNGVRVIAGSSREPRRDDNEHGGASRPEQADHE